VNTLRAPPTFGVREAARFINPPLHKAASTIQGAWVMGAIGKAFNAIGHGIGDAFKAVGHVAEGIVKLDFGKAASGLKEMLGAGLDAARSAANLSPAGFAANALMGGKLDQLMKWADKDGA
jgi:hypothetical protein